MSFRLIHPAIIDLYINTLTLHLLQEKIENIGSSSLTDKIRKDVDEATNNFSISVQAAESLFGSSDIVQSQLDDFSIIIGEA